MGRVYSGTSLRWIGGVSVYTRSQTALLGYWSIINIVVPSAGAPQRGFLRHSKELWEYKTPIEANAFILCALTASDVDTDSGHSLTAGTVPSSPFSVSL